MTPPPKRTYEEVNGDLSDWRPVHPAWTQIEAIAKVMDEREKRYEEQFRSIRDSMALALASAEKAVLKAEGASDKRFDSVNEFRQTLADQSSHFARADILDAHVKASEVRINSIENRLVELTNSVTAFHASQLSKSQAYSSGFGFIATGIGIIGAVIGAVIAIFFKSGGTQ